MRNRVKRMTALVLALSLLLTACGGKNTAATMHLVKTEGTVEVKDAQGKTVAPVENLGLFSGYALATRAASYGWISLDDAKLAKMDESSEAEVRKDGRQLELNVRSGNLFFNVTKPLEEDETLDIRTSTMVVGIRGTCGWVEVPEEDRMDVYLLKGKVECAVLDGEGNVLASETITAGQAARMEADGAITVEEFDAGKLPAFVEEALNHPENWDSPGPGETQPGAAPTDGGAPNGGTPPAEPDIVPWEDAGLTDHVMDWRDPALAQAMAVETGITDRDIMLSDVWEMTTFQPSHHGVDAVHEISDISALGELKNLSRLAVGSSNISDISVLAGMTNLTTLELGICNISDITPLAGLTNLTYLGLAANEISDLSALAGLTNLTYLNLHNNENISDISALAGLTKLNHLNLTPGNISDISALGGMTDLTDLYLSINHVSDISVLANLTNLRILVIGNNNISDISAVRGLTELVWLDLGGNHISDISMLGGLTNLKDLNLRYNEISDVSALRGLTELTTLNLGNNHISDVSALGGLKNLSSLYLKGNPISDYSPVEFVQGLTRDD